MILTFILIALMHCQQLDHVNCKGLNAEKNAMHDVNTADKCITRVFYFLLSERVIMK